MHKEYIKEMETWKHSRGPVKPKSTPSSSLGVMTEDSTDRLRRQLDQEHEEASRRLEQQKEDELRKLQYLQTLQTRQTSAEALAYEDFDDEEDDSWSEQMEELVLPESVIHGSVLDDPRGHQQRVSVTLVESVLLRPGETVYEEPHYLVEDPDDAC